MWRNNEIVDGTYLIMNELGRGGTGVIYLAYHLRLEKYVVIKRIKENFTDLLKVRTEVDILKKLRHTYLPQVYDFMQVGSQIYTVIDYIDGCDLDAYIKAGYTFSEEQIVTWLYQLCSVLEYLHSQRPMILHCDIKPGNIMINSQGNVCLIDFNVSLDKGSESELTGISQYYASPEQYEKAMAIVSGQKTTLVIDQRTDIYSLGATFYHMLSGAFPSTAGNYPLSQMGLGYSPELLLILDKMMAPNSKQRYKNTREVISALDRMYKKDNAVRKLTLGLVASGLVYAMFLVGGVWLWVYGTQLTITENFTKEYTAFSQVYEKGDFEETVSMGIDLLNDQEYIKHFKENPQIKAEVLHLIGESYFYEEYYEEALSFYKESLELAENGARYTVYSRDYAIDLIRTGRTEEAEKIINNAKSKGLSSDDLNLIQAEILNMRSQHSEALSYAEALFVSSDPELSKRSYLLSAICYEKQGDYRNQIECLEKAVAKESTALNLRKLGDAYIKYAEKLHVNSISERKNCYENAKSCYGRINDSGYATERDKQNLAVVYMELEDYTNALTVLDSLAQNNSDDYRVPMLTAFCYEKMGDLTNAREQCMKAVRLYENTPAKDKESATSNNIEALYHLEQKLR